MGLRDALHLTDQDNVLIALRDLPALTQLDEFNIGLAQSVPRGHKIALRPIPQGEPILRYGQIIGVAKSDIAPGEHVHVANLGMSSHQQDYAFSSNVQPVAQATEERHFLGYERADKRVGTRNYIGLVTTVNCSGSVARFIADAAERSDLLSEYPNIDGIVPLVHGSGCGMSARDEGYETLFRTLSGYAQHPNFGGVLLLGLGCEVMQISQLTGEREIRPDGAFRYMTIQNEGGTRRTIERALEQLRQIAQQANAAKRSAQPISKLMIGMQCGGSDGYSGITANPALGVASDLIVAHGGTTILSETSEIYGAEHLLTRRAVSQEVGNRLIERVRWWEDYTARNGGEMDNNPSPGNKRGGLTTILEKSLGAVAKAGKAPLVEVYKFAEKIEKPGFVFMDSPGFDPCSVTGQIASGANLIVFTTGRGSVSGYQPTPCVKVATNTDMFERLSEDMDLNCGDIITGSVSLEDKGAELFDMMIRVASGEKTKSEALGFGGAEFVPWQMSAVM